MGEMGARALEENTYGSLYLCLPGYNSLSNTILSTCNRQSCGTSAPMHQQAVRGGQTTAKHWSWGYSTACTYLQEAGDGQAVW